MGSFMGMPNLKLYTYEIKYENFEQFWFNGNWFGTRAVEIKSIQDWNFRPHAC